MARKPSVFVRSLSMEEGRRLQKISRTIVVLISSQGQTVKDITSLMQVSDDYVRDIIHTFNEHGFEALHPLPCS
ncbi:helix-turn-helix domain-containing protein [Rhodococcus sp. SJ-3]|uniref:helix-turn-helix domain-containing protein n=1 Tax=Rhodococcus sp. SJ-3 TaxID=3454628 RepID=UPI003F78AF73